ncbi:MAG: hypothetical protein D6798_09430 [Deltaproteobacteria bacterium]|nr:MAG: hypothetical protein D6798_09430 [Deltaproteobacteria bacterium]
MREAGRLDREGWRDLLLVASLSVGVRLWLSPWTLFNGAMAAYEKIVYSWGFWDVPTLYGDGWAAWLGPLHAVFGLHPDVNLGANLAVAALAPVALWSALRQLAGPGAARLGGLWLAVLPLAVALSATEVMTVPVLTLSLVAMAAAARSGLPGGTAAGALAGLAAGFSTHVRPEALLLLPAIAVAPLVAGGRRAVGRAGPWLALVLGGVLVGLRLVEMPPPDAGPMRLTVFVDPSWWVASLLPNFDGNLSPHHLFLDLRWTSPLLWWAVVQARRAGRPVLPFVVGVAATWMLLAKSWPLADAMRLQLVAAPAWIGLAAVGADRWLAGRRRLPWELAGVGLVGLHLVTGRLDLARHHEWRFLAREIPELPAGSVLRYDDTPHRSHTFASVLLALNPAITVRGASEGRPVDGELLLRSVSCLEHADEAEEGGAPPGCARVEAACRLVPVVEADVPARTDLDSRFDPVDVHDGSVTIGIHRLEDCR